jgi:hypothetical protein
MPHFCANKFVSPRTYIVGILDPLWLFHLFLRIVNGASNNKDLRVQVIIVTAVFSYGINRMHQFETRIVLTSLWCTECILCAPNLVVSKSSDKNPNKS